MMEESQETVLARDVYQPIWITIPAGPFIMGSDPRLAAPPYANESPLQRLELPTFLLSRVPITNAQYLRFVTATNYPAPGHWPEGQLLPHTAHFPVTYVTWRDAIAFCQWAGVRLPSEAEWEKAARGPSNARDDAPTAARWWPWGNDLPSPMHAHFDGQAQGIPPASQSVMAVGQFPQGASYYGILEMAGNVWEWTQSFYRPYPYRAADGREAFDGGGPGGGIRVVRGGSYNHDLRQIRCAARDGMAENVRDPYIGFRVATDLNHPASFHPDLEVDWVTIPAGPFWLGSEATTRQSAVLPSELPQHELHLGEFQIAQTPVTNQEYHHFTKATGYPPPAHWLSGDVPSALEQHPVTHVDWRDAQAFCQWADVRLLTEAEWERAAAGSPGKAGGRIYPWGDHHPNATRLNFRRTSKRGSTTPVGKYPRGATPEGVLDMAGNVWEWVSTLYAPYPYQAGDRRENHEASGQRVLRGGSFLSPSAAFVRCAMRSLSFETRRREHIGFRVAHK